jgi:hypothetical protein
VKDLPKWSAGTKSAGGKNNLRIISDGRIGQCPKSRGTFLQRYENWKLGMEYHSFLPNQITNKSSQNSGGIAQTLSAEIKENGGYVSVEDLEQYEWE